MKPSSALGISHLRNEVDRLRKEVDAFDDSLARDEEVRDRLDTSLIRSRANSEVKLISLKTRNWSERIGIPVVLSYITNGMFTNIVVPVVRHLRDRRSSWERMSDTVDRLSDEAKRNLQVIEKAARSITGMSTEALDARIASLQRKREELLNPSDTSMDGDVTNLRLAQERFANLSREKGATNFGGHGNLGKYLLMIFGYFGLEAVLNTYIFMFAIGGTWQLALLYALVIAASFAFMCHFVGARYKHAAGLLLRDREGSVQRIDSPSDPSSGAVVLRMFWPPDWSILTALVLFGVGATTILFSRYGLLNPTGTESLAIGDLFSIFGGSAAPPAIPVAPQITDPFAGIVGDAQIPVGEDEVGSGWVGFAILVAVNFIVIGLAIHESVSYHDSVPGFRAARVHRDRCQEKINSRITRLDMDLEILSARRDKSAAALSTDRMELAAAVTGTTYIRQRLDNADLDLEMIRALDKVNVALSDYAQIMVTKMDKRHVLGVEPHHIAFIPVETNVFSRKNQKMVKVVPSKAASKRVTFQEFEIRKPSLDHDFFRQFIEDPQSLVLHEEGLRRAGLIRVEDDPPPTKAKSKEETEPST